MADQYIQNDPSIMMGKPVIAGTRITVELILEKLGAGETVDQMLAAHPHLTRELRCRTGLCGTQVPAAVGLAGMSRPRFRAYPGKGPRTEAGAALLAFLLVLLVGASYALLRDAKSFVQRAKLEASRKTSAALAEAKAALIGYAVSAKLSADACSPNADCPRLGDLPCPDLDNDGLPSSSILPATQRHCGDPFSRQARRLGRLPWRALGLPDLRDQAGERLWYAVSMYFKDQKRSQCDSPGAPGCVNSNTQGTITVRAPDGAAVHDATNVSPYDRRGVIAVVLSPGMALMRSDNLQQDRSCTVGGDCDVNDACTASSTRVCDPRHYLDKGHGEENDKFDELPPGDRDNGFIQGEVLDAGNVIVNDRLLAVTYQEMVPLLEKRVVSETLTCLEMYASSHSGLYPWAADLDASGRNGDYRSAVNTLFGRVPTDVWQSTTCNLGSATSWWINWKELLFYGLANEYSPIGAARSCTIGNCLRVDPPSPVADRKLIIIGAGKRLTNAIFGNQLRNLINKGRPAHYLEDDNATSDSATPPPTYVSFTSRKPAPGFNDVVGYLPRP